MNLKRILVSCIAACMLFVSVPKSAHAYDYVRDIYPTTITAVGSVLSDDFDDCRRCLFFGLRWTQMVSDDWAFVAQAALEPDDDDPAYFVGGNYYIHGDIGAVYVSAHLGLLITKAYYPYLDTGIGFEYSSGHFVVNVEAGPAVIGFDYIGYHVDLAVGGRF